MIRRPGAVSELLIGACSQRAIFRRTTANRPGSLSVGWDRPAASVSDGASQYERSSVRGWFALAFDECGSALTPILDNLSIAPSWS